MYSTRCYCFIKLKITQLVEIVNTYLIFDWLIIKITVDICIANFSVSLTVFVAIVTCSYFHAIKKEKSRNRVKCSMFILKSFHFRPI